MTKKSRISWKILGMAGLSYLFATIFLALPAAATEYAVTNLVADVSGLASYTDPNLINPWGITYSATSPFWVSDNSTGLATVYNGAGQPFPVANPLVVTITGGGPTGVVFNGTASFDQNHFIFANSNGLISGWSLGTTTQVLMDNSGAGAVYTGLGLGNTGGHSYLYAANSASGAIDVFPDAGAPTLPGHFTDPNLPSGYTPFNVQNIGGRLLVTYRTANVGSGLGIVDAFDFNGNLIGRLITGGALNAPWGLAQAPANFGQFSNDLLVANFGDGRINAFNPQTSSLSPLLDQNGNPIAIDGLRALIFGNGGNGGDVDTLYFTAGPGGGEHGLLGSIAPVPLPSTMLLLGSGLGGLLASWRMRRKA